jgi:hypothetical protein
MKYAVEIGSGAMIYTRSFMKIDSGIHKLIGGDSQTYKHTDIQTHRQHGDHISLLLFFQNNESRLNIQLPIPFCSRSMIFNCKHDVFYRDS